MKDKGIGIILLIFMVFGAGCATPKALGINNQIYPTVEPIETITSISSPPSTNTPEVIASATVSATTTPSFTPTCTSSITPTINSSEPPHPFKQVLMEYGLYQTSGGALGDYIIGMNMPNILLYTDGQLLLWKARDLPILEKKLTTKEICSLLERINHLGFYKVVTEGSSSDTTNPLYKVPAGFEAIYDGPEYHVLINGENPKEVWAYELYLDYLVPSMKQVLQYLWSYKPLGLKVYKIDRLLLWVHTGKIDWFKNYEMIKWPEAEIHLMDYSENTANGSFVDSEGLLLEGEAAQRVFDYFKHPYGIKIFIDGGEEFTVIARPLLPHESKESVAFQNGGSTKPSQFPLPFKCSN